MAKIRIGVIGAGSRGIRSFSRRFSKVFEQTEVVAVADPNTDRAKAGLAYLDIEADIHQDAHDLASRKDVDAVVVASPDYLHEEHAVTALEHGKHVLVDKPLATTAKGCLRIIQASKRAGKLLYMGFNMRQGVVLRKLKQLIEANALGEIFILQAIEHYMGGRTFFSRWNRLKKYSGGLFIHKGSHDFDVINWLMGKVRPARVSCFGSVFTFNEQHLPFKLRAGVKPGPTCSACKYSAVCPDVYVVSGADENDDARRMWSEESARMDGYHKDLCMYLSDKDTHDQGIAIIEYENGATAMHSECFATAISNRFYIVEGTLGHAEADLAGNRIELVQRWTADRVTYDLQRPTGGHGGTDPKMCEEFVECILKKKQPSATGADGAWSIAVGEAAELSRAEGRVVKISELLDVNSPLLKP